MNITFLVHDIHFVGGGERVTANMANHFIAKGDQVSIVSLSVPKSGNAFNILEQVKIDYLNIPQDYGVRLIRKIQSAIAVRRYFRNVNQQSFILGIGTYPAILVALVPAKKQIIKIGCQHSSYSSVKYFWFILRWLLFRRLDAVVSLTQYDLPKLQRLNKNVYVIPNSVTFYPEHPADLQNKIILSIGRIDYLKGYDLLMEVFSRFCSDNKEWKLRIVGEGPMCKTVRKLVDSKGLTDRISILPKSDTVIYEYLNASVFLMTSRSEGLPMVLLEAQACGLPAIAFNCETGPHEIINNGKDGYLIDNYNIDEMSKKLSELCDDINKRKEFSINARENMQRFFPGQIYGKWEALFTRLQT
jgi:amylovoran biosynthesis glycosyltransferase AmsD